MPTVKGRDGVRRYMQRAPSRIAERLLPGAARAMANVVADEAKLRLGSRHVKVAGGAKVLIADAVKVAVKRDGLRIVAKVQVKGQGAYVAPWLEYGTAPHFIRVHDELRGGRTVGRINRLDKAAAAEGQVGPGHSLLIGTHFVGAVVYHPGAEPHPFLRPAFDAKRGEAIAAGQGYINAKGAKLDMGAMTDAEGGQS